MYIKYNKSETFVYSTDEVKIYKKSKKTEGINIKYHPPIPTIIGVDNNKKLFRKKQFYSVNNYPLYIEGNSGSGVNNIMLSHAFQNIENHEGVIFIENHYSTSSYEKIHSFCHKQNRLNDLYLLNFLEPFSDINLTSSIEPFNILISNKDMFQLMFGENTTKWLYPYLENLYKKNLCVSLDSLFTLFSFKTMFDMKNNNFGNQKEINEYLLLLGLNEDIKDEDNLSFIMSKHLEYNLKAINLIELISLYYKSGHFSDTPDIDFENIFFNRKILNIICPHAEKNPEKYSTLSNLICNILYLHEKNSRQYNMHFQNIYLDYFDAPVISINDENDLKNTKNKFTFSFLDYISFTYKSKDFSKTQINLNSFQSFLIMTSLDSSELSQYLCNKYSDLNSIEFSKNLSNQPYGCGTFIDTINMKCDHKYTTKNKNHFISHNHTPYLGIPQFVQIKL